jgi:DnaJ-class molecular chaperone
MDDDGPDYYAVLGCAPDIDAAALRKTFRRLAIQFHPDKNSEPGADDRFKEISEAYEVLSDPDRRSVYDRDGHRGLNGLRARETARRREASAAARESSSSSSDGGGGGGGGGDPRRPFGGDGPQWQRGNGGAGAWPPPRQPSATPPSPPSPPTPIERPLQVTLEELLFGCTKPCITRERSTPIDGPSVPEQVVEVEVEAGWKDGTRVTFERVGQGGADVTFVVHEMPHPRFERRNDDLLCTVQITLKDSLCGGAVAVPTLDGYEHDLLFTGDDGVITPGRQRSIEGLGMPKRQRDVGLTGERGLLVVTFDVEWPAKMSPGQRLGLSALL